nr:MAG TPA: hypothetical protein [Caudoviricetes sp.]
MDRIGLFPVDSKHPNLALMKICFPYFSQVQFKNNKI